MSCKTNKKPNVIFATIVDVRYDSFMCRYTMDVMDNDTQQIIKSVRAHFEDVYPCIGGNLVIWKNTKNVNRYVAYDDCIVDEAQAYNAPKLNRVTHAHFIAYKRVARERMRIKNNIHRINKSIYAVKSVNSANDDKMQTAKKTLIAGLKSRVKILQRQLEQKVY